MNKNMTYQHFEILVKQNLKVHILLYLAVSYFSVCFVDGGFEGDVQNTAWFAACGRRLQPNPACTCNVEVTIAKEFGCMSYLQILISRY